MGLVRNCLLSGRLYILGIFGLVNAMNLMIFYLTTIITKTRRNLTKNNFYELRIQMAKYLLLAKQVLSTIGRECAARFAEKY